ncbi:MAG TPA: alpha-mannosidase [Candidatus Eisenbergiella merdavium]|uniref:Alpha-mannosidase n=1 Tax=Candidatus Eisenbergiella merdavium TaxID=2838551 RepID=A0A9D2SS55_9FIRM|nr:alpha-mannosidase [Candidatus Eisenbergiella merdavium]
MKNTRNLHLICNAHIDPVWLWDLEEGISAALSTFRMAAAFCEEYDGLVFNHNEVLLYEWIEEMEPELFLRIKNLVREGKWHIMGGWYLQPDCNMPSGESFIRQMELGREYFQEKFGIRPTTAINFDPFGHSRGLVQLMAKAGFDSYLFCRPGQGDCPLPSDDFIWAGFDGSRIMAHRADTYGTLMGEAGKKIREWAQANGQQKDGTKSASAVGCVLWGVGNHGGGPSRADLDDIAEMMGKGEVNGWRLAHSTPEAYFEERRRRNEETQTQEPVVEKDLNPWAVGCYTSQIRVKQKHRQLEGQLSLTEKMLSQAVLAGVIEEYPEKELRNAQKALLFSEFHDVLPGTTIRSAEEKSLQMLEYGLQIVDQWKRRAFFALLSGQEKAEEGEYPILIYNPHPFAVEGDFTCDFQLANQNWTERYALPVILQDGKELPGQVEKEACNLNLDWRKRVVFHGVLKPACMNRFSARISMVEKKPDRAEGVSVSPDSILFDNGRMSVRINRHTGLVDSYRVEGTEYLGAEAFGLVVLKTDCDPWGMNRHSYRDETGRFTLMEEIEGSRYSGTLNERHAGLGKTIPSVRVIEDGPVRTVVEAVFSWQDSRACIRYLLSRTGTCFDLELAVNWAEKGRFLKLEIPTIFHEGSAFSETAYGVTAQEQDGDEKVFHRWCGLWSPDGSQALTVLNQGNYGVDFRDGVMRISLLHSAVYSAHPIGDRPLLVQDRALPYIDQGEREFSFRIQAGEGRERRRLICREAQLFQEQPMTVAAFPSGLGEKADTAVTLDNPAVILAAFRKVYGEEAYLLRLFETTGSRQTARITVSEAGRKAEENVKLEVELCAYEVKTLRYDMREKILTECGLFGKKEG